MRVGSLFSGIGGLDLGLERAGMEVAWQSEVDPLACKVLGKHWPGVPNLGDVTKIDWSSVERPDLVCGGYPCQPFSNNGSRLGVVDPRHLWPFMFDAVRVLRPRFVVAENVPGHLSLGFDRVLADLAALGFDVEWTVIPACALGAPHSRERLFFVAYPTGIGRGRRGGEEAEAPVRGAGHVGREREGPSPAPYWSAVPPPGVIGVAHGVRSWVDKGRLKAHGNAVVPQVAELVGRCIMKAVA